MKKKKLIIIALALVVLLIGGMALGFYYEISHNPQSMFTTSSDAASDAAKAQSNASGTQQMPTGKINIALLGLDKNEGRIAEYGDSFRTDTIMVFVIDFDAKKMDVVSIPRDSYVKIAGESYMDKINSAFLHGGGFKGDGFNTTLSTISSLLGDVPVSYYVAMDMDLVTSLVDTIGGVYYDVEKDVKDGNGRLLLKAGYQKLNGKQFMYYVRDRHSTPGGDIDRVKRQQKIFLALFDQMKSLKQLPNLPKIYNTFKDKMYTNLDSKQIAALAIFASNIDTSNIKTYMMPGDYLDMKGISYWGIDEKKRVLMVKEIFGIDVEPNMRYDVYNLKSMYAESSQEKSSSEKNTTSQSSNKSSSENSAGSKTSDNKDNPSEEGPVSEPETDQSTDSSTNTTQNQQSSQEEQPQGEQSQEQQEQEIVPPASDSEPVVQ